MFSRVGLCWGDRDRNNARSSRRRNRFSHGSNNNAHPDHEQTSSAGNGSGVIGNRDHQQHGRSNGGGARNGESREIIKREESLSECYDVDWSPQGLLGRGHFSEVYRGVDRQNGTRVAVKRISRKIQGDKTLRTEIEALLRVKGHPNIVSLYDVFVGHEHVTLAMELLEGGELFERIVQSGAYSERDASKHLRRITEALLHMHNNGIVHRDLKPENLVLASRDMNSEIKISDFGLSKILAEDQTMMATICGTNAYAAPEIGYVTSGVGHYDAKVDTWSLGVILFVLLAAYHPFDPKGNCDDATLRQRIRAYEWSFNDPVWENMSYQVKDLIDRLLCERSNRLSAAEILEHEWITNFDSMPRKPLNGLSQRSLRAFVSTTNLQVNEAEQQNPDSSALGEAELEDEYLDMADIVDLDMADDEAIKQAAERIRQDVIPGPPGIPSHEHKPTNAGDVDDKMIIS